MKRKDSILANFYYQKVPKLPKFQGDKGGSQVGGTGSNYPYHAITNPTGYRPKIGQILGAAQKREQEASSKQPTIKQGYKELPYQKRIREQKAREQAQQNSALAQTMALFTPSGSNTAAGAIGASDFVNMNPLVTGPVMSTSRLYGAGRSMFDPNTQNPYFGSNKSVGENILGGLGLAGDIGMLRMGVRKPSGSLNPEANPNTRIEYGDFKDRNARVMEAWFNNKKQKSGIPPTADDYRKLLQQQRLQQQTGDILRKEGVPDPRQGGAYKAPTDKLTWRDPKTGEIRYQLEAEDYGNFKTPELYKEAQQDFRNYKRSYLQDIINKRNANLKTASLIGEYGKMQPINPKLLSLDPETSRRLANLGQDRFTDFQMFQKDFLGNPHNLSFIEPNELTPITKQFLRNPKSDYFMLTPNKYGGLVKYQSKGEVKKKKPITHYVFAEDMGEGPFSKEAQNLKTFISKNYPGEQVEIIPGYGQEYFNTKVLPTLQNNVTGQDRVYLFGHHGSRYAGINNSEWGNAFEKAQKRAGNFNCYLGSCASGDLAGEEGMSFNEPSFSNINNFYYRPSSSWLGVNPNVTGVQKNNSHEGVLNAMYTRSDYNPNRGKLLNDLWEFEQRAIFQNPDYVKSIKDVDSFVEKIANISQDSPEYIKAQEQLNLLEKRNREVYDDLSTKLRNNEEYLQLQSAAERSNKPYVTKKLRPKIDYSESNTAQPFNKYIHIDKRKEYLKNPMSIGNPEASPNFLANPFSPIREYGGLVKAQKGIFIPGVTDFKMPRNVSASTSVGASDRRASANYSAQRGNEVESFIQNYQKKYPGATREQANFAFNTSKNSLQNQGQLKKAAPARSILSKATAIATNPMTALKYKVKGQDIPENFERGERNNLDMALDVVNPFSYVQAAKDVRSGINTGNYTQAGLGMLNFIPGKFFGKAASKLDNVIPNSKSTKQVLGLGTQPVPSTATPNLQFNLTYKNPPSNSSFISSLSPKNIKTSLGNLKEDVGYFFNKPKKIQDIKNERILQKELGQSLTNNKGSFNEGIYRLKRFPENLVKFENTGKVSRGMGFPEYGDFDFVKAMQGLPQENIAKVSHQLSLPGERRALFMNEVPGQSLYGVDPGIIRNIPESSISDAYSSLKKLRNKQLGFDFAGDNFNFNRGSKKINLFDVNPIPSNNSQSSFWRDNVLKGGDPLTYGIEGSGQNLKQALKEKLGRYYQDALNTTIYDAYKRNTGLKPSTLASYNNKALNRFDEKLARALDNMDPYRNGGVIDDDMGQWAHPGKVTRIKSPYITMQGVPYPVLGVSDKGDVQMMYPGEDYEYDGNSVTEFPMMQNGGILFLPQQDPEMMYTDRFNTELNKQEQKEFDEWVAKESKRRGRNILMDKGAYDVQGFWKSGDYKNRDEDGHGTDTWKKPNHPTFSNQSKYHGVDGFYGGNWTSQDGYQPSKQSADMYGPSYYSWMFGREPHRREHLDINRFTSGVNRPSPLYYKNGGGLTKYQTKGQVSQQDSVRHLAGQIMDFEARKGSAQGTGLSNYGNPALGNNPTREQAVGWFMQNVAPGLGAFQTAMEKGEAGDFVYNSGRDPRVYMLDQYLKSIGQTGLPNRGSYNVDTKTSAWTPELQNSLDQVWNQYAPEINKLPVNQRRVLLNKGRDFYYQNINKKPDGSPSDAYYNTWKPRIWESVNTYKNKYGGLIKAQGGYNMQKKYPIDLRLSQFRSPGSFFTAYGSSENPVPNVNVHNIGAYGEGNVNNRMRLSGNVNSPSVFYPGGNKMFMNPNFEMGMKYRFDDGGDPSIPNLQSPVSMYKKGGSSKPSKKAYGGPMVDYMKGKMNGPNMFKKGGSFKTPLMKHYYNQINK
jgi:hypothetical protein